MKRAPGGFCQISLVLLAWMLSATMVQAGFSELIPVGKELPLYVDIQNRRAAFWTDLFTAGYLEFGQRDEAWDAEVRAFLTHMGNAHAFGATDPWLADLTGQGEALRAKGCRDPLVTYCLGQLYYLDKEYGRAKPLWLEAAVAFDHSRYPAYFHWRVAHVMATLYHQDQHIHQYECMAWGLRALEHLKQAVNDGAFADHGEQLIHEIDSEDFRCMPGQKGLALQEISEQPGVPEWVMHYLMGRYHRDVAWKARGGGYANTVTQKGWDTFAEHQELAAEHWRLSWALHPEYMGAAYSMIEVARTGHAADDESENIWFTRCLEACFDNNQTYKTYLFGLRPRWGGSHEKMLEFGLACLNTGRFDTNVPWFLTDAIFSIVSDSSSREVWKQPGVWEALERLVQGYQHEADQIGHTNYVYTAKTLRMYFAYETEHCDEARQELEELGDQVDTAWLKSFIDLDKLRDQVYLKTSGLDEPLAQIRTYQRAGQYEKAAEALEELFAREDANRYAAQLNGARQANEWLRQYESGEWVSLTFDDQLTGWKQVTGDWAAQPPDTVVGTSKKPGLQLLCQTVFRGDFELELEGEFIKYWYRDRFNLRILIKLTEEEMDTNDGIWCQLLNYEQRAAFLPHKNDSGIVNQVKTATPNHIRIVCQNDLITMDVNGKPALEYTFAPLKRPEKQIALAALVGDNAQLAFHKVRIRKMSSDTTHQENTHE